MSDETNNDDNDLKIRGFSLVVKLCTGPHPRICLLRIVGLVISDGSSYEPQKYAKVVARRDE